MTLKEFVEKYKGKKIDYDGAYGAQCVDVFRQYCKDVLNIPHTGAVTGARELYTNYEKLPLEKKYFERIAYKEGVRAEAGDTVIFDATANNKYGHVAIVLEDSGDFIKVFEQDGYAQTGAYIINRPHKNVLGFLRKKGR